MNNEIKFFAGRNSKLLAENIANSYGTKLSDSSVIDFSASLISSELTTKLSKLTPSKRLVYFLNPYVFV